MCFHEFYECPVGVLGIGKRTGSFSHVKAVVHIYGKRKSLLTAFFPQQIHAMDIETQVDESQVTPESFFIDLLWFTVEDLDQFELACSEKGTECSKPGFAVS